MILLVLAMMAQTLPPGVAAPSPPPPKFVILDVLKTGGNTQPRRINDQGQIVGLYGDLAQNAKGFLWERGKFTTLHLPGAAGGPLADIAINDRGQIAGSYNDNKRLPHGFLVSHGTFTSIDYPGSRYTHVFGINDSGQMVGFFSEKTRSHGFRRDP